MKTSLKDLDLLLSVHEDDIGTHWRHRDGDYYFVTDVSLRERDLALIYTYAPVSFPRVKFNRPVTEFVQSFKRMGAEG